MTSSRISARNRANAQRSTGPRTARGKAIVASNALRHGATARPDPGSIAAWLAVILERPDITPGDLLPGDESGLRALALAQAEAHLVAAERALQAFEAGAAEPSEGLKDLRVMADLIRDELRVTDVTGRDFSSGLSILQRIARAETVETRSVGRRHRLLRRYLREARAKRRRSFKAWVALRATEAAERARSVETPNYRNKASLQPQDV